MPNIEPGYAAVHLAKALTAAEHNEDRINAWTAVITNILSQSVEYGSRTPIKDVPAWATLEVVTGGFATGKLLAGGPLLPFEQQYLQSLSSSTEHNERLALNSHFLSDAGMARLQQMLDNCCYEVNVPEEGALLVVAWLARNGHADLARGLVEQLAPYFSQLRFYPIPTKQPRRQGPRVHIETAGTVKQALQDIRPNKQILAQKEAVQVWAPFNDRVVSLFSETYQDGWPCRNYAPDWKLRAIELLNEYPTLRAKHTLCAKQDKPNLHYAKLRALLQRCATDPTALTSGDIGAIRMIVDRNIEKHGPAGSASRQLRRTLQARDVAAPMHNKIAALVAERIDKYPANEGIEDTHQLKADVQVSEATDEVPAGTRVPPSIGRKAMRCQSDSVAGLVRAKLIPSSEALAKVLPQLTSGLSALSIEEPSLRNLYAAIYRAFRRRRSLLLLNLEKQVGIDELPWIAAANRFRSNALSHQKVARQALEETTILAITSFPQTPIPNKLLQEFSDLANHAAIDLPLTEELATDIFMGQFSGKFNDALSIAGELLNGTIYSRYYAIDYSTFSPKESPVRQLSWFRRTQKSQRFDLAEVCAERAGVPANTWRPATNGMIIEQQQVLTSQNLATLFAKLDLGDKLQTELPHLSRQCFKWICARLQVRVDNWHSDAIRIKNAAYAWRQMVFFLSLQPESEIALFIDWANSFLSEQPLQFQNAISPAWNGLVAAAQGIAPDQAGETRRFLGWSNKRHWLATSQ
jgi:hypothetical protein